MPLDFSGFSVNDQAPLHTQIRQWLLEQFADYPLESKLPTDRELAAGLEVAPLTIKRVMGDLERQGLVLRQQGRGTFLSSRERRVHGRKRAAANGEIIFAYPNYYSYEYWQRAHFCEEEALKAGYGLVELKMNPNTSCTELLELVNLHPLTAAVFIAPVPGSIDRTTFDALDDLGIPVVIFAHCDFISLGLNVYSVVPDRFKSGYLQMETILEAGHRELVHIANEPSGQDGGETIKGMRQCLKDQGHGARSLICLRGGAKPWENSIEAARRLTHNVIRENLATAIFVDSMAGVHGCLHGCWELGVKVPEQISLISAGTPNPVAPYLTPPITSVYSPCDAEIRLAMSTLHAYPQAQNRTMIADVMLDIGKSIAPPASVISQKETTPCN